jgi:hypothetical protein
MARSIFTLAFLGSTTHKGIANTAGRAEGESSRAACGKRQARGLATCVVSVVAVILAGVYGPTTGLYEVLQR